MALDNVGTYALFSRILVLLTGTFFNNLMPDHKPDVFNPPSVHRAGAADTVIKFLFGGLRRWDGIYFMHIAEYGYTYENCLAFFPMFPLVVRIISYSVLYPLHFIMNVSSVLLLSAVIVNLYCFVKSAKILHELGKEVTSNDKLAYKAVLLYCVNPASIFFSAPYSESMFAMFLFMGMLHCEKRSRLKASYYFGFATLTRSNGIVAIGFILYFSCKNLFTSVISFRQNTKGSDVKTRWIGLSSLLFFLGIPMLLCVIICIAPFAAYQYYAFSKFCDMTSTARNLPTHISSYGIERHYKMTDGSRSLWCFARLPLSYSYVQSSHWGVGFLEYYQIKQIPNFALAAPMIILSTCAIVTYVKRRTKYCIRLGLYEPEVDMKKNDDAPRAHTEFFADSCFVHVCYMAALLVVGMLFMHVQVITRFVASSCPVLYWYVATLTSSESCLSTNQHNKYQIFPKTTQEDSEVSDLIEWNNQSLSNKLINIYFLLYFFVGTAAFTNFLPWT